jgi:hypothetical protein
MSKTQTKAKTAPKTAAAPKKAAAPKPSVETYGFRSGWSGPSDLVNARISRTKLDPSVFNRNPKANVTQRDTDAMIALRSQFGDKPFERRNCDAGILRRLMERGLAQHVGGDCNAAVGTFRLTKAGMGK